MRRRGRRPLGLRLGFSLLVTVAALGGMEATARVFGPGPTVLLAPGASATPADFRPDPILGWRTVPGATIEPDRERLAWEAAHGLRLDQSGELPVSPEGFRDTPLERPRPPGALRVIALGDSSVWGHGVRRLDTFSERVEAALPDGVEVINGGVPGYSSFQVLTILEESLPLGLDGLIVYALNSDVSPTAGLPDSQHFSHPLALAATRLLYASALFHWLRPMTAPMAISDSAHGDTQRVQLSDYRANLARFTAIAHDQGAWVLFVIPPQRMDMAHPPLHKPVTNDRQAREAARLLDIQAAQPRAKIESFRTAMALEAWRSGAPLVDGPRLIAAAGGDPDDLFVDPVHPSPIGHALLAEAITPLVLERLPP